ncbi:MAG: hypothetical protein KKH98_01295 [Spirochaetes bacterium]|nr:hypothetical protein [Spirochaetota bacterium]
MQRNILFITFLAVCFFIMLPVAPVLSFSWTEDEIQRIDSNEEITVLTTTNMETETEIKLKDKAGHIFSVLHPAAFPDRVVRNILKLKNDFFSWVGLQILELKFIVTENELKISLLPSEFLYSGTNISQNLPAGMFFTYTDSLQYNFRIMKDNMFIRIKGFFIDPAKLCEKIMEALKNPIAYIQKRDPEYFLSKLNLLQDDIDKLRKENSMLQWAVITLINDEKISRNVIDQVVALKKADPMITISRIRDELDKKKISLSKGEVNVILTIFFNEFED